MGQTSSDMRQNSSNILIITSDHSQEKSQEDKKEPVSEMLKRKYGIDSGSFLKEEEFKKRMSLIQGETNIQKISSADVIIEAVFEEMSLKKDMFKLLS